MPFAPTMNGTSLSTINYQLSIITPMFRKTPLAWLQITREKTRLAVALAGIAFADILMFLQLGFKDALYDSSVRPHYTFQGDLILINSQFETFFSVTSFPRERLLQAAGFDGVESVNYLYAATARWRNPETRIERPVLLFGIDPAKSAFNLPDVNQNLESLKMLNRVLFDRSARSEFGVVPVFEKDGTVETEMNDILVHVTGLFTLGASFTADGNAIVSDSTFLHLFDKRKADDLDVGLINLKTGTDIEKIKTQLRAQLPKDVNVLTIEEFAELEKAYWANGTAIGFIFSLGAGVGFIVGIVIVYQILYTDVSDHLPEYATLKAMGYTDFYLIQVLAQEALILAFLGFIPGFALSIGMYNLAAGATMLPIGMSLNRSIVVLILTVIMCVGSGTIALRKLQAADPADIF
jgi:putative ABC transport system permease protein